MVRLVFIVGQLYNYISLQKPFYLFKETSVTIYGYGITK